jgi:pimeloyl-ACP methyl ester carboxylesterase
MDSTSGVLARIESSATRVVTRAGDGAIVWRIWGDGPPLVLLHGASGSWTHWTRNILPLSARFRLLVPDMPGFGDSDAPPEPHSADGLADLVTAALDVVVPPPAPVDIAGFSFGGIIGGLVAARLRERVGTLVVLAAGGLGLGPMPTPALRRIEPGMSPAHVADVHRENLRRLMFGDPGSADDLAVAVQIDNLRRARFKSGTIPQSDVLLRALPAIRARLAGMWGSRDAFMGQRLHDCRRALTSGRDDVPVHVLEGVGHWVTYEAAEEVNRALIELLTRS